MDSNEIHLKSFFSLDPSQRMEPLVTNRQCLIWLCVCPADESARRWQKLAHATFATYVIIGLVCTSAACLAFYWTYVSIDLGKSVYAFMLVFGQFTPIYAAVAGIFLQQKIGTIFDSLTTIYAASKLERNKTEAQI